ncbi:MAG: hypothetical protein H5U29_04115 [Pusillimonas sp.]|nr:hypothetical protein [Pusillimonas sp.]
MSSLFNSGAMYGVRAEGADADIVLVYAAGQEYQDYALQARLALRF